MGIATPPVVYRLGLFTLEMRSGDLIRSGRPIRLQEKPRNLLMVLAGRPGELITRTELRERLWPEDTFVDFEDGLNAAMSKLREALGDDTQSPRYIETVRGRGYRFIAKVELIPEAAPATPQSPEILINHLGTSSPIPPDSVVVSAASGGVHSRKSIAAILIGCLVVASTVIFTTRWRAAHAQRISVAVLPFVNLTGDPSRDYVCNGITEELIAQLSHLGTNRLRVIAPTSARTYANTNKTTQQIARELNVQYLIKGSLDQQGSNIRVMAQLVRAKDQSRLWANVYKGDLSDQFEFENSVAESVASALSLKVPSLAQSVYHPGKFEAHDAYLKGLYFSSQRSKHGFEQAIESFGNAVAIDPRYAAAYARLAATYNLMGQYNWMSPENARSQAWAAAQQALSVDPTQAEAHAVLGFSLWYYQWDVAAAEAEFHKAIALEPDNVDAHHWYEQLLMTAGRFPEAEQQMQAALDVDPRSPILRTNLGWLHYFEGRYPQAIREIQAVLLENPNFLTAHYKLWYTYSTMGDQAHAWQEFQWVVHSITAPAHEQFIREAYRRSGYNAALQALVGNDDAEYYGSAVDGARCEIFSGNREGALHLLDRAYRSHEGWMIYAPKDPAFAALRTDTRFQQLMEKIRKKP